MKTKRFSHLEAVVTRHDARQNENTKSTERAVFWEGLGSYKIEIVSTTKSARSALRNTKSAHSAVSTTKSAHRALQNTNRLTGLYKIQIDSQGSSKYKIQKLWVGFPYCSHSGEVELSYLVHQRRLWRTTLDKSIGWKYNEIEQQAVLLYCRCSRWKIYPISSGDSFRVW